MNPPIRRSVSSIKPSAVCFRFFQKAHCFGCFVLGGDQMADPRLDGFYRRYPMLTL